MDPSSTISDLEAMICVEWAYPPSTQPAGSAGSPAAASAPSQDATPGTSTGSTANSGSPLAAAPTDLHWNVPEEIPEGWNKLEIEPEAPTSANCYAALFHGDRDEYFCYACLLGRRLREGSPGADRVLICGPGRCRDAGVRGALRAAGWSHLLPVAPVAAAHLDRTGAKRHALVFTKLRVLELPYSRVLLLDLDLLPRYGSEATRSLGALFKVPAPAAKYHSAGPLNGDLVHGDVIPSELRVGRRWSPNAGVMRLDPKPSLEARREQVGAMIAEVADREGETYLPEQYYLAERLAEWRHIDIKWNWEVCPEWDDPGYTYPVRHAHWHARRLGWAGYYLDGWGGDHSTEPPDAQTVLNEVCVWHFSGSGEMAPWMLQSAADANGVRETATQWFRHRDPGGVVATAFYEWRYALENLLAEHSVVSEPLAVAAESLRIQAIEWLQRAWWCDKCLERGYRVREVDDLPYGDKHCTDDCCENPWMRAECIVEHIVSVAGPDQECACELAKPDEGCGE